MPTLREWIDTLLSEKQHTLKSASLERLSQSAGRLLNAIGENVRLDEVSASDAAAWRAAMTAETISEATVRLHCRNAKTIFGEAAERELIHRNPCVRLKSASVAGNRDRYVTPEEAAKHP